MHAIICFVGFSIFARISIIGQTLFSHLPACRSKDSREHKMLSKADKKAATTNKINRKKFFIE